MSAWKQEGFAVLSDGPGLPLVHGFATNQLSAAQLIRDRVDHAEDLRRNIRVVPAVLQFEAEVPAWSPPQEPAERPRKKGR